MAIAASRPRFAGMVEDDDTRNDRLRVRRGVEHINIRGATDQLGQIVPPQVITQDELDDLRNERKR